MPKLVMLPPQTDRSRAWSKRLSADLLDYQIVLPETEAEAAEAIADAEAAYGYLKVDTLRHAKNLQWLQSPQAAPPAGFYYPELIEHPVTVCNPRGVFNDHIAQHIVMCVLALARGLPYYADAQREARWDTSARKSRYIELGEATALIVGVGGIGHETARLLQAFGTRIIGVDARWEYEVPKVEKRTMEELDALLPHADFVIVTLPHTPETEGMWNAKRFEHMGTDSHFINIGRGMTTKLDDLADAIESGTIAGCALDVYEIEPLPSDHRLWKLPNVILTPHIAVKDADNVDERMYELFLDNARRFAEGRPLRNVVQKKVWH